MGYWDIVFCAEVMGYWDILVYCVLNPLAIRILGFHTRHVSSRVMRCLDIKVKYKNHGLLVHCNCGHATGVTGGNDVM